MTVVNLLEFCVVVITRFAGIGSDWSGCSCDVLRDALPWPMRKSLKGAIIRLKGLTFRLTNFLVFAPTPAFFSKFWSLSKFKSSSFFFFFFVLLVLLLTISFWTGTTQQTKCGINPSLSVYSFLCVRFFMICQSLLIFFIKLFFFFEDFFMFTCLTVCAFNSEIKVGFISHYEFIRESFRDFFLCSKRRMSKQRKNYIQTNKRAFTSRKTWKNCRKNNQKLFLCFLLNGYYCSFFLLCLYSFFLRVLYIFACIQPAENQFRILNSF